MQAGSPSTWKSLERTAFTSEPSTGFEGERIKLTKKDSGEGSHEGHHHFIPIALVADVEGQVVRLSANADVAVTFEEEADGSA